MTAPVTGDARAILQRAIERADDDGVSLTALSRVLEDMTGYDSIETALIAYEDGGSLLCPFPSCGYRRFDAGLMWAHAHGITSKHKLSFTDADVRAALARLTEEGPQA